MHSPPLYKVIIRGMVDWQAVDIPAIVRVPTRMVDGKVIDARGQPLVNAVVKAENGLGRYVGTTDTRRRLRVSSSQGSQIRFDQRVLVASLPPVPGAPGDEGYSRKAGPARLASVVQR